MKLMDFFVALGVKVERKALDDFESTIKKLPEAVFNLKNALLLGVVYGMDKFVESTIEGTVALENLRTQTGLSIEELQKWQKAGQLSNLAMSAEEISGSIASLQKNLAAIRMGQGNVQPFAMLGMNVIGKDAFQVLDELRDKIKDLSPSTAGNLLSQMGLTPGFINILKQSREEFDKLGRANFLSEGQRQRMMALGVEIRKLKQELKLIHDHIAVSLYPMFAKISTELMHMAHGFEWLFNNLEKHKVLFWSIVGAFGVLAGIITYTLSPALVTFSAILAAFLLIVDDLVTYFSGSGKSVTGLLVNAFEKVSNVIMDFFKPITDLLDRAEDFINKHTPGAIKEELTGKMGDIDFSGAPLQDLTKFLGRWFEQTKEDIKTVFNINTTIHVDGSEGSQNTAEVISKHLNDTVRQTLSQIDNGAH